MTLGKNLMVVSFGVFIHEDLAVSSQGISVGVSGIMPYEVQEDICTGYVFNNHMLSRQVETIFSFGSTIQLLVQKQRHSRHFRKTLVKYLINGQMYFSLVLFPSSRKDSLFIKNSPLPEFSK